MKARKNRRRSKMGCDIHMYAEVKDKEGKWLKVGTVFKNPYYRPEEETKKDKEGYTWNAELVENPYKCRNYDLFAILANVRNGFGFAGCDTGNEFIPIDTPRGLPDSVSPEVKKESDEWGGDGHSHSWFTLKELHEYPWKSRTNTHRGWVSPEQFEIWRLKGKPESWSGGVGGHLVEHITWQEMDRKCKKGFFKRKSKLSYYCSVEWEESYYESCKDFVDVTIPALQKLGKPEDVRIVFWFDN